LERAANVAIPLLDALPVLTISRDALLDAVRRGASAAEVAEAIETGPNLALAVLRLAARGSRGSEIATVMDAVEELPAGTLAALADSVPTFDPLDGHGAWSGPPARFRLHALTVRRIAERIALRLGPREVDACITLALIHDVGKLALHGLGADPSAFDSPAMSPEQRIAAERAELGTDHAAIGAALARRWHLSEELASGVEHHHEATSGPPAVVRIADMLAHYASERTIDLEVLVWTAEGAGVDRDLLSTIMYELPQALPVRGRREDCPLSERELEILRRLAAGMVAKQIASDLDISPSTVRNHLNRIYKRLEVYDRAQAVLLATERGWL
jgi:putative nucleotidyltransferase with HDIG domain